MDENILNIKIGDMFQSDTGTCGIVIELPNIEKHQNDYILYWNRGETKIWGADLLTIEHLVHFGKWKIITL